MEKLSANHSVAVQFPGTPTDKLRKVDGGYSERAVLLSCGSFSPVTRMHLQMLGTSRFIIFGLLYMYISSG